MKNLTEVRLSRSHLLHNVSALKTVLGSSKLSAAVKANAYGHGLDEVVSLLEGEVDSFQVDDYEELLRIRRITDAPVMVLGYVPPSNLKDALAQGAEVAIFSLKQLAEVARESHPVPIHIAVDSLFGREGFLPSEIHLVIEMLRTSPSLKLQGIYSHFSSADSFPDLEVSLRQREIFEEVLNQFSEAGFRPLPHMAASGAALGGLYRGEEMARMGLSLYGMWPSPLLKSHLLSRGLTLHPVMEIATQVAQVKVLPARHPIGYSATYHTAIPTKVALLPVGYSDGIDRRSGGRTDVLIRGERCRLVGRVSMNMCIAEVGHLSRVEVGDEVLVLGEQGYECITAEEVAIATQRINYEVTTLVSPLLPRVIVPGSLKSSFP